MLLGVTPANAEEIVGIIKSAPGESQASFVARNSFKSFSCEAGTTRVDGVDLNFTSTSSDDVYFAYCVKTKLQPAPIITPIVPVVDTTTTATATVIATPIVTIPALYEIETQTVVPIINTATSVATSRDTSTLMVVQSTDTSTAQAAVTALSTVIMATKSGVKVTKKENAKVLIRKKGKK